MATAVGTASDAIRDSVDAAELMQVLGQTVDQARDEVGRINVIPVVNAAVAKVNETRDRVGDVDVGPTVDRVGALIDQVENSVDQVRQEVEDTDPSLVTDAAADVVASVHDRIDNTETPDPNPLRSTVDQVVAELIAAIGECTGDYYSACQEALREAAALRERVSGIVDECLNDYFSTCQDGVRRVAELLRAGVAAVISCAEGTTEPCATAARTAAAAVVEGRKAVDECTGYYSGTCQTLLRNALSLLDLVLVAAGNVLGRGTELGIDVEEFGAPVLSVGANIANGAGLLTVAIPYVSLDDTEGAGDPTVGLQARTKSMSCEPSSSGTTSEDWTEDPIVSTFSGKVSGSYYAVEYGKLNASRRSTGEFRYHILGCVFGNGRATEGRLRRVGGAYAAWNASRPDAARLLGSPTWDTDLSDEAANTKYDIKAEAKGFAVTVSVPVSSKTGHLDGLFGGSGPQSIALDKQSLVNTVKAWWQNDCPGNVSCGVRSTRGSVLEGVYGFGMDTEPSYTSSLQAFAVVRH